MFIFFQIILVILFSYQNESLINNPQYFLNNNESIISNSEIVNQNSEVKEVIVKEFNIKVPILVYHNIEEKPLKVSNSELPYYVTPKILDQQFKYLSDNNYTTLTFKDIKLIEENKLQLPKNPIIITFDDGRESQYLNAFPLLQKYNFKAIFYVFTNAIDRENYLTWKQLKELRDGGMEIGDHTRYHWYLTKQTPEILQKEIIDTKKLLEDKLNIEVLSLAYPFGLYNDEVINYVTQGKFNYARSLKHTTEISNSNRYILGSFITQNSLFALQKILTPNY